MRVALDVITMVGNRYLLLEGDVFPSGDLPPGEGVPAAARRLLRETTGLEGAKIEMVDVRSGGDGVALVLRALFPEPPKVPHRLVERMGLPAKVGRLDGAYVEEALKTSLSYKLTRG